MVGSRSNRRAIAPPPIDWASQTTLRALRAIPSCSRITSPPWPYVLLTQEIGHRSKARMSSVKAGSATNEFLRGSFTGGSMGFLVQYPTCGCFVSILPRSVCASIRDLAVEVGAVPASPIRRIFTARHTASAAAIRRPAREPVDSRWTTQECCPQTHRPNSNRRQSERS